MAGATLVYVASLPNRSSCSTYQDADGTLYTCGDVLYRPTYYKNEQVYEVVSDPQTTGATAAAPASNDADAEELLLTSPFMRGERVRAVQNALQVIGFDVGKIDGIYGNDTDRAVREFQEWWEIPVTGVVDPSTAEAIGEAYAWTISPETYYAEETTQSTGEEAAAPADDDAQADDAASDTQAEDAPAANQSDGDAATDDGDDAAAPQTGTSSESTEGGDASSTSETGEKEDTTQSD